MVRVQWGVFWSVKRCGGDVDVGVCGRVWCVGVVCGCGVVGCGGGVIYVQV